MTQQRHHQLEIAAVQLGCDSHSVVPRSTAEFRERVLPVLYWATFGLVILKIMSFLHPEWFDGLARPLGRYWQSYLLGVALITTGASAAMTAYYINQNTRSLFHRYYSISTSAGILPGLLSKQFTDEAKNVVRAD